MSQSRLTCSSRRLSAPFDFLNHDIAVFCRLEAYNATSSVFSVGPLGVDNSGSNLASRRRDWPGGLLTAVEPILSENVVLLSYRKDCGKLPSKLGPQTYLGFATEGVQGPAERAHAA